MKGWRQTIEMTQEDIDLGTRYDFDNCPVKRALDRYSYTPVRLGVQVAEFNGRRVETPESVRDFIQNYDSGYSMYPIIFEI